MARIFKILKTAINEGYPLPYYEILLLPPFVTGMGSNPSHSHCG